MILRLLFFLPGIVLAQNPYGPSQLDQYARLLNSGNIGGFGLFNQALQTGQVRSWGDLSDPRYLPGLPPLPLTHAEVMAQLAATQPPPITAATSRPTMPTSAAPPMSNLYVGGINPIPEMPPMAEERLHGKFDDDGVFHPDSEKEDEEKLIKRNHIQGTKIRDFSDPDRQKAPTNKDTLEKDEDYEKDENYDDPEIRVDAERPRKKKESSEDEEEEHIRENREPKKQIAVTVDQSAVKQRRKVPQPRQAQFDDQHRQVQVRPSARKGEEFDAASPQRGPFQGQRQVQNGPVPQQQRPQFQQAPIQQPQLYPTFVYRQKPAAAGRDAMLTNLLTEIEEYDDFLDQQHSYNEQFPQVPVNNPYRQLPDGQLPALQAPQPQLQTVASPTHNSQFHQPAQTAFNPPQWPQQRAVQQASPQQLQPQAENHPFLNLLNLFNFPQNAHALAAPTLHIGDHKPASTAAPNQVAAAQPVRTAGLVDIQQRPLQFDPLSNLAALPIFPGK